VEHGVVTRNSRLHCSRTVRQTKVGYFVCRAPECRCLLKLPSLTHLLRLTRKRGARGDGWRLSSRPTRAGFCQAPAAQPSRVYQSGPSAPSRLHGPARGVGQRRPITSPRTNILWLYTILMITHLNSPWAFSISARRNHGLVERAKCRMLRPTPSRLVFGVGVAPALHLIVQRQPVDILKPVADIS